MSFTPFLTHSPQQFQPPAGCSQVSSARTTALGNHNERSTTVKGPTPLPNKDNRSSNDRASREQGGEEDTMRHDVAPVEPNFWKRAGELIARATQPQQRSQRRRGRKGEEG